MFEQLCQISEELSSFQGVIRSRVLNCSMWQQFWLKKFSCTDLTLDLRTASLKEIQLIEVKSEIGAGTQGSSLGLDAMKTASFQIRLTQC